MMRINKRKTQTRGSGGKEEMPQKEKDILDEEPNIGNRYTIYF
jgi:hypothetical protein